VAIVRHAIASCHSKSTADLPAPRGIKPQSLVPSLSSFIADVSRRLDATQFRLTAVQRNLLKCWGFPLPNFLWARAPKQLLHVEPNVAGKLHAGSRCLSAENFALVGKIRQFWHKIYSSLIFNFGCIKTAWGLVPPFSPYITDERSAIHLLICGGVSK